MPEYRLVIDVPDDDGRDPDGLRKLRRMLKHLKRSWGVTCKSVSPTDPEIDNEAASVPRDALDGLSQSLASSNPISVR